MKLDMPVIKRTDFVISAVIALLILAWNLKNSFEFGRLAFVPSYDDIAYFNDALLRYHKFLTGNVFVLLGDVFSNPPHSPVIAFQAVISYIVFGVEDWAPYVGLVWIPFLVILLAVSYTIDIERGRWILVLYVATTPLLGASVVEFRPDIGNGIFTTLAIVFAVNAITESKTFFFTRTMLASAFFLGGALLFKPSAAVYTVALFGFAEVASLVALLLTRHKQLFLGLKRAVSILVIGLLVSLPYYLAAGHRVIEYTYNAVVRDKKIWAVDMSMVDQALFYLVGHGGRFMLGLHFWASIAAVVLFFIFRKKFTSCSKLRLYVLIATTFVGYVVVAANSVKTHFLGVTFQALLVCISFIIFSELLRLSIGKRTYWPVISALLLVGILSIQPTGYWGVRDGLYAQEVRRTVEQVNETIRGIAAINDKPKVTFMTFTGFLNRDVVTYDLLRRGVLNMRIDAWFWRPSEEKPEEVFGRAISGSDVVIAATEGTRVAQAGLPSNTILPLTLSLVQQNSDFVLLKSIPSGQGSIHIYVRKSI
jgi:hypothetical protein